MVALSVSSVELEEAMEEEVELAPESHIVISEKDALHTFEHGQDRAGNKQRYVVFLERKELAFCRQVWKDGQWYEPMLEPGFRIPVGMKEHIIRSLELASEE